MSKRFFLQGDFLVSSFLLAFSIVFWFLSEELLDEIRIFPRFFLTLIAILSAITLVISVRKSLRAAAESSADKAESLRSMLLPYSGWVIIVVYAIFIPILGFFVSTAIFSLAFMFYLKMRNWVLMLAVTTGLLVCLYLIFILIFQVPMPKGLLL